jgi:hypothetical protein
LPKGLGVQFVAGNEAICAEEILAGLGLSAAQFANKKNAPSGASIFLILSHRR